MNSSGIIAIVGPNPKDPSRNGGVARYISYLQYLDFESKNTQIDRVFLFTDVVPLSRIGLVRIGRFLSSFAVAWFLLRLSNRLKCVHVNATLSYGGALRILPIILVSRFFCSNVVIQIHGGRWGKVKLNVGARLAWKLLFRLSRKVGCFSGFQYDELTHIEECKSKLNKLVNFIPKYNGLLEKNEIFTCVFLGRVIREKGILECIEAVKLANDSISNGKIILEVVGDGPLYPDVTRASDDNVIVRGRMQGDELDKVMAGAHLLLLPSYYPEGFPLVFLEAANFKVVPLISNCSAISSYFMDGEHYFEVPVKSPVALAGKIQELYGDRILMEKVSSQLRAKFTVDFSSDSQSVFDQYIKFYSL